MNALAKKTIKNIFLERMSILNMSKNWQYDKKNAVNYSPQISKLALLTFIEYAKDSCAKCMENK